MAAPWNNVYNQTITPPIEKRNHDYLLWLLAPILVLVAGLGVWSPHFQSGFHLDDFHTIVGNETSLRNFSVGGYFVDPQLTADAPDYRYFKPLLTTNFALDYLVTRSAALSIFQIDSFAWFLLNLIAVYGLFVLLSGRDQRSALLGTAIFGLHPVAAETVNYISRRGTIMGSFGLVLALSVWILWAKHLPARILYFDAVPKTAWDEFRRIWYPKINVWYRKFIRLPLGLYMFPVVLAMLSDPTAAVFAPILLVYMRLFDNRNKWRRILPAAVVCLGYWVFQLLFTWRFGADTRPPLSTYLVAQPLVIIRYFYTFLVPLRLSAVSGVNAIPHFWSPLALAGYAGLACIIGLAIVAGRRPDWRGVSFGIWWFLIALAPGSLVPQQALEDDQRMYLAMTGLCFAAARSVWIVVDRMSAAPSRRLPTLLAASVLILLVLVGCGWTTYARNQIWISETALWGDATEKSPQNPVGFVRYANALTAQGETDSAYQNLLKAAAILSDDPVGEIALARAFDLLNRNTETEQQFRRATSSIWQYSPAFSAYAQWLFVQRRFAEAYTMATRALALDSRNLAARHTLIDYYSAENKWKEVKRLADETLHVEPQDNASLHARDLAESVFEKLANAENKAEHASSPDDYLNLSVAYFQNQRFEDSIRACQRALAMRPSLAEAYSNIAAANYALGRQNETEAALREAIRLRPDLTVAKQNLDFILGLKAQSQTTAGTPLPSSR